jgi:carboxymethylenebutenolidase
MSASGDAITIRSREGRGFACYLAMPRTDTQVPAVVLASTVRGVDADLRAIADEFAANGFIAAAPDLFWRSTAPSPSRVEQIRSGEGDMADALAHLGTVGAFNGRAAVMGFCYGGPYAILGPKRLGYAAGISCHGTQMLDYIHELDGVEDPVCVIWGDRDHLAPAEVLDAYRDIPARMKNVEVHIFPGVFHGYMMSRNPKAFDQVTRDFSMERALAILRRLVIQT